MSVPSARPLSKDSAQNMKKRTEIRIETHRVLTMRRGAASALSWCEACSEQVTMVPPEEAAVLAGVSTRTMYRWIEAGKVHFGETRDHLILVCAKSIS